MPKKYYLSDEYEDNCDCVERFGRCPCASPASKPCRRERRPSRKCYPEEQPATQKSNYVEVERPAAATQTASTKRTSAQNTSPLHSPRNSAYNTCKPCDSVIIPGEKPTQNSLNAQFPCPCMSVDMEGPGKDNLWDLQFYRWWGWNWLKKRENILREQMEKEGKRFSEEFPILMMNYYANETKQQQQVQEYQERKGYATEQPEIKQEKRWSLVKSLNNALKAFKGSDTRDAGVSCQCEASLNVCGPCNKPCGGREGPVVPCGYDCTCNCDRQCLTPYLQSICPCKDVCNCPKDRTSTRAPYSPSPQNSIQGEMNKIKESYCSADPPRKRSVQVKSPSTQSSIEEEMQPQKEVPTKMKQEQLSFDEGVNRAPPPGRRKVQNPRKESVEVLSFKMQKITSDDDYYCCSCDEDPCECCCCGLDVAHELIQTSQFCLRESFTQTDKMKRKCCRCCRCCSNKRKDKLCTSCANPDDGRNKKRNSGDSLNSYDKMEQRKPRDSGNRPVDRKTSNTEVKCCGFPSKTLMVRANSIQCIPPQETKGTCCSYDDTCEPHNVDRFMSRLYGPNYEKIAKELFPEVGGDIGRHPIKLDASDINAMTSAKLRNFFLEGDVYSSPVTGRNYDLSYRTVDTKPKMTSTKLLKPLSIDEELKCSKLPSHCFSSDMERTTLMSAICETILTGQSREPTSEKNSDNNTSNAQIEGNVICKSPQIEVLQPIKEDNESAISEVSGFDNALNSLIYKDEMGSENVNRIFEIQEDFKNKIEKLEKKMEKLINNNVNNAETALKAMMSAQNCIGELVQKQDSTRAAPVVASGSVTIEKRRQSPKSTNRNDPTQINDPIAKYENLVMANHKRVDELLGQLNALNSSHSLSKMSDCSCFEKEESIYKPNLGTNADPALRSVANKNSTDSCKSMLNELDELLSKNARGDRMSREMNDLMTPSTSSPRDLGNWTSMVKSEPFKGHQHRLDFSSIVFVPGGKPTTRNTVAGSRAPQNFIVQNLRSFNTSISDSYAIEKLLRDDNSVRSSTSDVSSHDSLTQKSSLSVCSVGK